MKKLFFILSYFILHNTQVFSQQITDYFAYYINDTFQKDARKWYVWNNTWHQSTYSDINSYSTSRRGSFLFDDENLYYINILSNNISIDTYYNDTFVKGKAFNDVKNSNFYFCKYNFNSHKITAMPFGGDYDNALFWVQMDIQKKTIFAIISTWDDTLRLDPSNQNDIIAFPNKMQRYWLLTFNLDGKLLSKYFLAQADKYYNKTNNNILKLDISKFDYNDDILLTFTISPHIKSLFPWQQNDTSNLNVNYRYITCFSQTENKIKWFRILKSSYINTFAVQSDIENIKLLINVQLSKQDSIVSYSDENNKIIAKYEFKNENINPNHYYTHIFRFDAWGNITQLFNIESKKSARLLNIIQNNKDQIALIQSNDSFKIFGSDFNGEMGKKKIYESRLFSLLKLDINKQIASELIKPNNDSIVPKYIQKLKNGFLISYIYDTASDYYNILPTDTFKNIPDDYFSKYSKDLQDGAINLCKFDTSYHLKWLHKLGYIVGLEDYGNRIIIEYYNPFYDIDFRKEQIGSINPMPNFPTAVIYNCKPLSYYQYSKIEDNTFKFTNLSEYNCNYKWIFGDGVSTTQKSPSHKFKSSASSYKVTLITTNECGSDTFYRYIDASAAVSVLNKNRNISIYPNPISENEVNITVSETDEIKSVKIYNTMGQQIDECAFEKKSNSHYLAQLNPKPAKGIYFIKVIFSDNSAFVSRILVD